MPNEDRQSGEGSAKLELLSNLTLQVNLLSNKFIDWQARILEDGTRRDERISKLETQLEKKEENSSKKDEKISEQIIRWQSQLDTLRWLGGAAFSLIVVVFAYLLNKVK